MGRGERSSELQSAGSHAGSGWRRGTDAVGLKGGGHCRTTGGVDWLGEEEDCLSYSSSSFCSLVRCTQSFFGNLVLGRLSSHSAGATLYRELCVRCLSNLVTNSNATQLSHQQLAQTALRVSLARAQSTRVYITEVAKQLKKSKAKDYQQVKDCFDQINDGVDQITNSIKELQQMNEDGESDFPWHASNVQTWMSTALTDASSCLDGFSGRSIGGKTKAMIKAKVLNLVQVTSNALALFNRFAARYRASHRPRD
ncbi:pectinesterase inhibitor 9-like [Forsythia ovata]|uniref:Pectinesterase inhibitor 9-like n=1 Tax=Forsythia ovata TaxID=205694 RepID=A0ABD1VH35_9LAMI